MESAFYYRRDGHGRALAASPGQWIQLQEMRAYLHLKYEATWVSSMCDSPITVFACGWNAGREQPNVDDQKQEQHLGVTNSSTISRKSCKSHSVDITGNSSSNPEVVPSRQPTILVCRDGTTLTPLPAGCRAKPDGLRYNVVWRNF